MKYYCFPFGVFLYNNNNHYHFFPYNKTLIGCKQKRLWMCFEYFSQWILDNNVSIFKISFMIVSLFSFMGPFTFFIIMGYKSCSVLYCKNNTRKKNGISLHITENPEMQNKWLMQLVGKRTRIVQGARKAGFLGFMMNFVSIKSIYYKCVENGPLNFLLTEKLSQDHLEHFFGR